MLQPIGKRILATPYEEKHGTLILTNRKPTKFTVVAVGDDVTKVKVSDLIYLDKYSGIELDHDKDKYVVLDESQILAKVECANACCGC